MTRPWLVLDTAGPIAVIGVWHDGSVLSEYRMSETRRHAEGLIDGIDRALLAAGVGLADLGGVGAGSGPGSFIGVRTGIATAKGICLGRSIPLVGLPTLLALARGADVAPAPLPFGAGLVVVDAKRGELYAQLVEKSVEGVRPLDPPAALSPADVIARARSIAFVVGAGLGDAAHDAFAGPSAPAFISAPAPTVHGLGQALRARLDAGVTDELDVLVPAYCRPPDAKLPASDPSSRRGLAGGH